uniref:Uncharacterized protein n=1 Tax=Hanusia phi TaxID=3032 RepID=A0A7S0ES02_9CRYP
MGALVVCVLVAMQSSRTLTEELVEEEEALPEAPSISSTCIRSQDDCVVAVQGGSLKLSNVEFPNGKQNPGTADAVGYVNGKFVTGKIKLSPLEGPGVQKDGGSKKAAGRRSQQLKDVPAEESSDGETESDESNEEYKATLAAVEANIEERQKKVEEEAKKIAEAVTRVITSKEVSKKIADLAMDTAAEKEGPVEASLTGAVTGGVNGVGQFGYSSLPSGTQVPNCGTNCGKESERGGANIPPASSASTAFYSAWKAGGGQAGVVVPQTTVTLRPPMPRAAAPRFPPRPYFPLPAAPPAPVYVDTFPYQMPAMKARTSSLMQKMKQIAAATGNTNTASTQLKGQLPDPWQALQAYETAATN